MISKAFPEKLKKIFLLIISQNQRAYVKSSCVRESGRLIPDTIDDFDKENIPGYLVTMDIEKAFKSLYHDFLICS